MLFYNALHADQSDEEPTLSSYQSVLHYRNKTRGEQGTTKHILLLVNEEMFLLDYTYFEQSTQTSLLQ